MATDNLDDMDTDYAAAISTRAIQSMSQLSVPVTPSNYSVWFNYVLGTIPNLRKTMDIIIGNKRKFDAAVNRELYNALVSAQSDGSIDGDAPQQLNGIIDSAKRFLANAILDNKTQIEALGEVASRADASSDPRPIIETLIAELAKANSRASVLEKSFVETSAQLEKVQVSLAEAEKRSNTDTLTELANRRSLDRFLRTSMTRSMETGEPLCAFMVDIDHFKKFNDIHGHLIGDQVLRLVARVLKDSVRDSDLAARYGGEELFVVMPGINLAACKEVAERVRHRISDAKLKRRTTGEEIGSVAVSIGIAQFRLAEPVEALIERCDRGLYQAKSAGRNRTVTESEIEEKVAA